MMAGSSTRTLLAVLGSTPVALLLTNTEGRIVFVNPENRTPLRLLTSELVGAWVEKLVPARFREAHSRDRATFVDNGHSRAIGTTQDLFGLHKNGTEVPLEITLTNIELDGTRYTLATVVGVRRLKEAEARLRRADRELQLTETRYRDLIEGSIQGILIVADDRIQLANRALAELVGAHSPPELVGESIWRWVAPVDHEMVARNMRRRLEGQFGARPIRAAAFVR